jgi:hypothetical protein
MSTLEKWMGALTDQGFDLIGVTGYTSRNEPGTPYESLNHNMPMQHLTQHYRWERKASPRANAKTISDDLILSMYSTNSRCWHVYAVAYSGVTLTRRHGFIVQGDNEREISGFENLEKYLKELSQ